MGGVRFLLGIGWKEWFWIRRGMKDGGGSVVV